MKRANSSKAVEAIKSAAKHMKNSTSRNNEKRIIVPHPSFTMKSRLNKYVKENGYIPTLILILQRKHDAVTVGDEAEVKRQDDILMYYYNKYEQEIQKSLKERINELKRADSSKYIPRGIVDSLLD